MPAKTKIGLDAIEQAHRALDALPEHRPQELTKTQAIQKLLVPIRATQSKGYSLAAIGQVLAECGIPITTGALRAYLSEANAGGGRKQKPTTSGASRRPKEAAPAAPKSRPRRDPVQPPGDGSAGAKPSTAASVRGIDLDWDPAARSDRAFVSGRASFPVRPDTKDL